MFTPTDEKKKKNFFDVEFFFGSYLLLSPLRSDASENLNTVEGCFIAQIEVLISIESDTDTDFSCLVL